MHCKDKDFFYKFGNSPNKLEANIRNMDWYFTFLRDNNFANIKTFYVENLRMLLHRIDVYRMPFWSGMRYWNKGRLYVPILCYGCGTDEKGSLALPQDMVKLILSCRQRKVRDVC